MSQRPTVTTAFCVAALATAVTVASLGGLMACSTASSPSVAGGGVDGGDASTDAPVSAPESGSGVDGSADASPTEGGPDHDAAVAADGASDAAASSTEGGEAGVDGSFMPPPVTPVCSQTAVWGAGTLLAISTSSDDELDSITPDALTIAWTEGTGASATLEIADRASTTDPFGAPQSLAAGQFTADRVALSPDGLRLVVVNADAQGFSELTRSARTSSSVFGAAATGSYANLNGALSSGLSYGDPVLGADDAVFYYSVYGGSQTATIYRTARLLKGDTWPTGAALTSSTGLAAQGTLRRRPTGISSDEQTLFFFDEVMGIERAAWIDSSTGAYDAFVNLAGYRLASPVSACDALYYSAQGASSIDLFVAND
jgi:hypothetical protein